MRFSFDGKEYVLDFHREYNTVRRFDVKLGDYVQTQSKYPDTVVKLKQQLPETRIADLPVILEERVRCFNRDQFDPEMGRVFALRRLGQGVSKEFRAAMWTAYTSRERGKLARKRQAEREVEKLLAAAAASPAAQEVVDGEVIGG